MIDILHNETRNLLIQAYNKTHNAKDVAECFSFDVSTVYRLVEQMNREGSVSVKENNLPKIDTRLKRLDVLNRIYCQKHKYGITQMGRFPSP